ncbi:MAG: hypothetical protein ABH837_04100 [bacterium]
MGNQPIIDNQNTQQIGQNPTNQPPVPPVPDKPKVNFWMISTILFACLFFVVLGIYIFASSIRNKQESQISKPTEQTGTNSNIPSSNQDITLGTKFAYLKTATEDIRGSGDIIVSNFDGSYKQKIHAVPIYVGTYSSYDVSDKSEKLVYKSLIEKDQYGNEIEQYLWVSDKGTEPRKILTSEDKKYIESPKISVDGEKIAYSLLVQNTGNYSTDTEQLWVINSDGTENKLVIDKTRDYLGSNSRFRLVPVAWSQDETEIYLQTTSDSEATPIGMYVANLLTGKIEKANTPQVTLWGLSFSPDRTKIAYTTYGWKDVPDNRPEPGAPFTISVTDLSTGATIKILESNTDQFDHPVWSNDGLKLAYKVLGKSVEGGDQGIYVVDVNSRSAKLVTAGTRNARLRAWSWLSGSKLIYSEESYTTGEVPNKVTSYLFTINLDGTDKQKIDSAREITVFGALR